MSEFTYHRASGVADAVARLAADGDARPLAGGMTLLPTIKHRLASPSQLIDIARLPALRGIRVEGGELVIGAATRHVEVAQDTTVLRMIPALAELAGQIGDPQVRARGTIGGSLANNDPAADYPAAVLALDATIVTDRRQIAASGFFDGMFTTTLAPDELIVAVRFKAPRRAAYEKFPHPASGYAMAGVFVADCGERGIQVAVTGAAPCVFRWTQAEQALRSHFVVASVAGLTLPADDMNADLHAAGDYRANLARVMAMRAVARLSGEAR
jgi:aerobic carbon-monoxide dehydrogenase medium subunit